MTKYVLVADLRRCVGCQTCTAACKHANATPPDVQWRKVLDIEFGEFPDVRRVFVPVGCMHCDDPPCQSVCPTLATQKRADGIVTIDYDRCIGCAYCVMACPYQARYKVDGASFAYGDDATRTEQHNAKLAAKRMGVAQKCSFCVEKIDAGTAQGLKPGVDPDATPACVNSCLSGSLSFGDADDPNSKVSKLIAANETFRMHEELGTGPNIYYIWEQRP